MEIYSTTNSYPRFHVLIAAAGSGTRAGAGQPKQYRMLGGACVLRRTISTFTALPGLLSLRVIINLEHRALYEQATAGLDLPEPVQGGADRRASVAAGLQALAGSAAADDLVLIHDAARPFVSGADIEMLAAAAQAHQAATLATKLSDTVRREDGTALDRAGLWALQTPQGFHYGLLRRAHEQAPHDPAFTDDTALTAALGTAPHLVPGRRDNFKLTTEDDLMLAEKICAAAETALETRIGTGFDVHAFDPASTGPVRLCGLDIAHNHKLAGHSDADVGLHAVTDALLGAAACGDIGSHFPPSDPQWQGKDSAFFLAHAVDLIRQRGGLIDHLDLTLICEAPKIGPHRDRMRARIAEICALPASRVSVKATTTEGLGFTGRGEGIAAQAVATIRMTRIEEDDAETE